MYHFVTFPERLLARKVSTIKGYAESFSFTGGGLKGFHVVGVQIPRLKGLRWPPSVQSLALGISTLAACKFHDKSST